MKSYFAKLAARATVANIPVAPSRFPGSPDPFEAVAPEFGTSSPTIPQPTGVRDDAPEQNAHQPVLTTDSPMRGDVVRVDPARSDRDTGSQPLPRLEQPTQTPPTSVEIPLPREAVSTTSKDSSLRREHEPTEPVRSENKITTPILPNFSPDLAESEVTREPASPRTDAQLEEIQREQSILLRKADAFMSALLERPSKPTDSSIERQADFDRLHSKAEAPHTDIPARLQPTAPTVRARDDRGQPSLVIGKLTVEVMPPPAPPVAPSRQVVIVRESRSVRGATRNSIQRFGLGQF